MFKEKILKLLNKIYREDEYTKALVNPLNNEFNNLETVIKTLNGTLFFNQLTVEGCKFFEGLLKITIAKNQTITDRQAQIEAKWKSFVHNDIFLLQSICDAWKNGEVEVDFINGKIQIKFVGEYGVPDDLNGLTNAINSVKPAHLAYYLIFKYLLIENIHEVMTLEEMEQTTLENFAFGIGE